MKSEPEGANIYRVDNNTLMGATPVTLPIELVGTSSMRIRLEKPGYETFEQTITGSDPISISLAPSDAPAAAPDAGAAAPAKAHRHHAHKAATPSSDDEPAAAPEPSEDNSQD